MDKISIDRRIRANLIRLRLRAGLDQNALARKSGVTHIAQIESGHRSAGKEVLSKLADVLGVDIYEFFLPENIRTVKDDSEKVFLELLSSCSTEGRKIIMDTLITVLKYEKKGKNF
jgi:transcriptional regulator with XRE-family HTH domain